MEVWGRPELWSNKHNTFEIARHDGFPWDWAPWIDRDWVIRTKWLSTWGIQVGPSWGALGIWCNLRRGFAEVIEADVAIWLRKWKSIRELSPVLVLRLENIGGSWLDESVMRGLHQSIAGLKGVDFGDGYSINTTEVRAIARSASNWSRLEWLACRVRTSEDRSLLERELPDVRLDVSVSPNGL